MTKNALTTLDFSQLQTRKTNLAQYASTNSFLRRIELCGGNAYAKQGKIAPGNIGIPISKEEVKDLGKSVDLYLFAVRDKCLDLHGDKPLAVFDTTNPEYERIFWEAYDRDKYEEAGGEYDENGLPASPTVKLVVIKGANNSMTGYMQGPSFLVFERSTGEFYELYCSNASHRAEAKNMGLFLAVDDQLAEETGVEARGPIPCTFKGKFKDGGDFQYWVPVVTKCSEPFDNLPTMEIIAAQINKFLAAEIEGQDEEAEEGERAR